MANQIAGGYGGDAIASYYLYLLNIVSLQISDEPYNLSVNTFINPMRSRNSLVIKLIKGYDSDYSEYIPYHL